MGRAIAARTKGDDYQARVFCVELCRLFDEKSKVTRVVYEAARVKHFEDVVVHYKDGMFDVDHEPLQGDYFQVKFHVDYTGCVKAESLINPDFIHATTSVLQRVMELQRALTSDGRGYRFIFYINWSIDHADPLRLIVSGTDYRILWDKLAKARPDSELGKVRRAWREHLNLASDAELEVVLRPLRIYPGHSFEEVGKVLNAHLRGAGLVPVADGAIVHPYDDLVSKLLHMGRTDLTAEDAEQLLKDEGLWRGYVMQEPDAYRVGIRSFFRWAEDLGDKTDAMLSVLEFFDGRHIKSPELWRSEIFPRMAGFLPEAVRGKQKCALHLPAHATIALAAGYCLPPKLGVEVAPVQPTPRGLEIWRPNPAKTRALYPTWQAPKHDERLGDGSDVVVALSVTHDVLEDARLYAAKSLPQAGRILCYSVEGGPRNTAVEDGTHAKRLADALAADLRASRTLEERGGRLHIFAAAPNGLLFFIGQLLPSLGRTTLYEYDFDSADPGAYQESFSFPPTK